MSFLSLTFSSEPSQTALTQLKAVVIEASGLALELEGAPPPLPNEYT